MLFYQSNLKDILQIQSNRCISVACFLISMFVFHFQCDATLTIFLQTNQKSTIFLSLLWRSLVFLLDLCHLAKTHLSKYTHPALNLLMSSISSKFTKMVISKCSIKSIKFLPLMTQLQESSPRTFSYPPNLLYQLEFSCLLFMTRQGNSLSYFTFMAVGFASSLLSHYLTKNTSPH